MNIRLFKNTRFWHKWVGLVCAFFFLILAISGILLMHYEEFGLGDKEISGRFLPSKYFEVATGRRSIQALAFSGVNNENIFIGTNHGVYRSRDKGKSWEELKQGLFNQDVRVLVVPAGKDEVVYAGTAAGIFKSENGGDSWSDWFDEASGLLSGDVKDLAIHPENPVRILAATGGGLFLSVDGGESWEASFTGKNKAQVNLVRFSAVDPDTIYIGTGDGAYRSTEGGKTWQRVWRKTLPDILSLLSLNTEPEFLYVGTSEGLFKSFNKGRTWIKDKTRKGINAESLFSSPSNSSILYLASGSQVFKSENGGDTWQKPGPNFKKIDAENSISQTLKITRLAELGGKSPILLAGTTSGLFISRDNGKNWEVINLSASINHVPREEMKMDLVKLITEIHTGRFFGSYFLLLVDIATVGLILLIISGFVLTLYRYQIRKKKKLESAEALEADMIINIQETADDLNSESMEIHDMIEHISNHLDKCKTVYMSREKKEIDEIGRHITTLDRKMHHLMQRIGEFEKFTEN